MLSFIFIMTDFCSWWAFWWIAPFLLGIALGRVLWGKYKDQVSKLKESLRVEKAHNYDLEKQIANKEQAFLQLESKHRELDAENNRRGQKLKSLASSFTNVPSVPNTPNNGNYKIIRPTNLQIIEGIGPKIETLLKENGIADWSNLADKSHGELRALLDKYDSRYNVVDPSSWPKQALLAKTQDWEQLIAFQRSDGSTSKCYKILVKLGIV